MVAAAILAKLGSHEEQNYRLSCSKIGFAAFMRGSKRMLEFGFSMETQHFWKIHGTSYSKTSTMTDIKSPEKSSYLQSPHPSFQSAFIKGETSNIDTIKLATFRSKAFDRWWGEWKLHLFHQSASMYMTDLFPDIVPQLFSKGLSENQPMLARKERTRSSAVNISALAPKKKTKTKKTTSADDLPALDPSIEQALDEEIIEDDVDEAAAKQSTSDQTPSAIGSHHIEEEIQLTVPTIPVLADLFSFDIKDYLNEGEEDTTSKALAPLSDDVKKTLENISHRLEASSLDSLVVDCGSIRTRLHEIQALIPDELADILTLAVYLEQHQFKLEKAKLKLAKRRERKDTEAKIQANRQLVHEEKSKLDQLSEGPIKSNIDRLEARKIELLAQLQECNAELDLEHKKLADLPRSVEEQKARLKSAIKNVADLTKSLKIIPGTDAQDAQAIKEVEQIRQRAISAIQQYLSQ
uniref:DUF1409 domain-containing protein n=1 Tax=Oryza sativa subsp. japonica TaxID=39947 RepID=Q8S5L8_ORYSJ|nr:Hypothetical protein [Oryza sativa Japonica Group]